MTPVIRHLYETFPELSLRIERNPLDWTFMESIKRLGPEFYRKIVPLHLVLNLEYSLLGQQLRAKFLSEQAIDRKELTEQLIDALLMAELLEHIYECYLIVPREVVRLRQQQNLYRELLAQLIENFPKNPKKVQEFSFTQEVRNMTVETNLYRLLFTRSKRALDFISQVSKSESYLHFVRTMDKVLDPFIAQLAWIFFLPRLLVNFFVVFKHTVPGWWMEEDEKSLGWSVRFSAQIKRRWFELGNDIVWFSAGFLNCYILIGALAPFAFPVSLAAFAFDVIMSLTRAYIELSRLYELRSQYTEMLNRTMSVKEQREINEHLKAIDNQIAFEQFRLGSHLTTTTLIFLAMCCALPMFAAYPIIPVIGAVALVVICFVNFALADAVNESRPADTIDRPSALSKLGFFVHKEPEIVALDKISEEEEMLLDDPFCCLQ
ncbi:Uncharacterised protein [Legionella steigerwaltii]|uniref:Coiled-coil protein n=1 Tax=Legionella steigerwaltii TaxID=460 RepID=A0A378LC78_9GAMM|nr:hypothetical protein [Legionella steigerwaltii]KTD71561.1 hypothetical protein Lstg_2920 [Legionella steigerwaltii]STY24466.1 Uncharacterised protein [Legionella steigerwaltii]